MEYVEDEDVVLLQDAEVCEFGGIYTMHDCRNTYCNIQPALVNGRILSGGWKDVELLVHLLHVNCDVSVYQSTGQCL
jgi:hypothetical protein